MSFLTVVPSLPYTIPLFLLFIPVYILISDYLLRLRLPPGPPPIPLTGNKYDLPPTKPWLKFQKWSKTYGPIFTIWFGRRPTIVISDPIITAELLEKRSNKYSSRPRFVAMGELHWDMAPLLVQPYGKEFTTRRKLLHHALTPSALKLYKPVQEAEASRLCFQLLHDPENWEQLIDRFAASIVFSVAYGHRIDSMSAAVIRERLRFMQIAAALNVPGAYLVETFPILKYVPSFLAPWKREMQASGREEAAANIALLEMVKREIAQAKEKGADVPNSLTKLLLEIREKEPVPLSKRDFAYIPASLFGAGSDTTASTLCSAVLALVTHPQALKAAHEELDRVIGSSRTPTFADEANLPYICALAKEVLRWRPVAALGGVPHFSTLDDVYEGWFIPRGTTILGNTWAINLNELYYPDPHLFEPLRFLDKEHVVDYTSDIDLITRLEPERSHPSKTGHSSFGWGRRICPGEGLAENSLFVALAKILWAFDIKAIDGVTYDINDYTNGFNIRPRKFQCEISVRGDEWRNVLEREMNGAEEAMSRLGAFGD